MLCRGGVTFVDKMDQFIIWRVQSVDNTPSDQNSKYSVKRRFQPSPPSSHQPSKRLSKDMPPESFDVKEKRDVISTSVHIKPVLYKF